MKNRMTRIVAGIVACTGTLFFGLILQSAVAQDTASLPYMNQNLSPEQRATDLVHRMTLAETRAAVAAASGDFKSAEREAGTAREEALRLGQPVERASALLAAYHDGRLWTEEPWPAQQR